MGDHDRRSGADAAETLAGGRVAVVARETVWQGFIRLSRLIVEVPRFGGGRLRQVREVHDHGSAAVVLPIDPIARKALLVRQWRIPPLLNGYAEPLLEAVAGLIDAGETPEETVRREMLEETGREVGSLTKIAACYSSPGTLTEFFHLYIGNYDSNSRLHDGGGLDHEEENIEVVELDFDELRRMFEQGAINDAKTHIAVAHVLANNPGAA